MQCEKVCLCPTKTWASLELRLILEVRLLGHQITPLVPTMVILGIRMDPAWTTEQPSCPGLAAHGGEVGASQPSTHSLGPGHTADKQITHGPCQQQIPSPSC